MGLVLLNELGQVLSLIRYILLVMFQSICTFPNLFMVLQHFCIFSASLICTSSSHSSFAFFIFFCLIDSVRILSDSFCSSLFYDTQFGLSGLIYLSKYSSNFSYPMLISVCLDFWKFVSFIQSVLIALSCLVISSSALQICSTVGINARFTLCVTWFSGCSYSTRKLWYSSYSSRSSVIIVVSSIFICFFYSFFACSFDIMKDSPGFKNSVSLFVLVNRASFQ